MRSKRDPSLEITIDVERRSVEAPAIRADQLLELDDDARLRLNRRAR